MTKVVVNFDFYIIQCTTSFNLAYSSQKKQKISKILITLKNVERLNFKFK